MGVVYLVGAGPGAADLLTLRALRVLRRAQVVFHDALVHPDVVALAKHAEKVAVGKRCGRYSTAQRFINKRLIDAASKVDTVVRLKGGDPMLFGRAQEEIDALRQAGVTVKVIPGVTSALAASAELALSLTRRGMSRSVVFATPRVGADENPTDWVKSVVAADTAVLYMAAGKADQVASALLAAGMDKKTPVAVVEYATLPAMRSLYTYLHSLPEAIARWRVRGPALLLLGDVYEQVVAAASSLPAAGAAARSK